MDAQPTIVITFKCQYNVQPQWLLSIDKYYLLFVNRREQGNNERDYKHSYDWSCNQKQLILIVGFKMD